LLVNLHQEQALAAEQLEEPLREVLKRSLAEGKPITQAWVRAGDAGLQLEFQNVVPVRDLQGKLQAFLAAATGRLCRCCFRWKLPLPKRVASCC
jgi:hypothetical protein